MKGIQRLAGGILAVALLLSQFGLAWADTTYIVQAGDTITKIAQKFNVSPAAIVSANGLSNPNLIYVGQRLIIPSGSGASSPVNAQPTPAAGATYIVQPGDTLLKIMQKFKVSASALIVANRLANPSLLFVGQRLIIPGTGEVVPTAVPQPAASAVPVTGDTYVVQSGDTLYKIAAKLKVDASALIAANQLTNPNLLYVGQRLIIPGGVPPTAVPTAVLPTATPVPATATSPTAVPTATPSSGSYTARGIHGDSFSVESTSVRINTDVWFNFKVTNTSGDDVYYTALAAHTDVGYSAWSWTNQRLGAGESLSWRDHIKFDKTGTYQLYLGICFAGDTNACKSQPWDRLSPSVTVSVQ